MCGRYSLFTPQTVLEDRFDVAFEFEFGPRYNATPGQSLPVITDAEPNVVRRLEWGLIPRWADDSATRHINARSETVAEKPAFTDAYENRRCLVPSNGFYEWVEEGTEKQPYRVAFEDDRPFAMAGLWERWTPTTRQTGLGDFGGGVKEKAENNPIETFTVLTTEPNEVVEPLHHRMAVILEQSSEDAWLAGEAISCEPTPADAFHAYPVSEAVNNPKHDSVELIQPIN